MSDAPPRRRRFSCLGALLLLAVLLVGAGLLVLWRVEVFARRVAQRVEEVLHTQPTVTVRDHVVVEQNISILELAVVTRDVQVEREREHEWLGSVKRLKLRGVYRVRAGYDLTKHFEVRITGKKALIILPPAKILSVDQVSAAVENHENGLWNKVRPEEVGAELARLTGEAQKQARSAGITLDAQASIQRQLQEKLGADFEVEIQVRPPAASGDD